QHRYPGIASGDSETSVFELPAGLAQARHVAAHRRLAQLVTGETELAVHAARAAGQLAAIALARRARVARKLLQLRRGGELVLVRGRRARDDLLELNALAAVTLDELRALDLAVDHGTLCHIRVPLKSVTEREAERFEK